MIKLAIVDDHQMFLDGICAVLSQQPGMQVLFAANAARSALKQLKTDTPDLVITDISMPDMNGIEFVKILRKEFPSIGILVVSMFENLQNLEDADGFLLKETDNKELVLAIKTIAEGQKYFRKSQPSAGLDFNKSILSKREKEIITLIAEEFTSEEMAQKLFVSKHTIEAHRKNIFLKLQVKNIAGLIKKAIYLGVIK